ncbi:MAG: undecaprenyl-diphosphatase UppP [Patescibacteria group bacterium]
MLTAAQGLLLGTIQGLTEFLPISSSGHLILARDLLHANTENGLAFDAVLQLGSILAVYVYFRKEVWRLICAAWSFVRPDIRYSTFDIRYYRSLLKILIIGTIPAFILGLLLEKTMETIFRSAGLVALMLILGSGLFWLAEKYAKQTSDLAKPKQAWWIGVFQTLALVPGMSRSGSTISGGLLFGLKREAAARFSFLLSLPVITGSGLLMLYKLTKHGAQDFSGVSLALGFAASLVVGYACIAWLIGYLKKYSLMVFVWYRLLLAALIFIVLLAK